VSERTEFRLAEHAPHQKRSLLPVVAAGLVAAILALGAVFAYVAFRPDTTNGTAVGKLSVPLSLMLPLCHEQAKRPARAPATVQFSGESEPRESPGTGWWQLDGLIDAQNGFGALIRNRYSCTSQRTPTGWQGTQVTFSPWN
jgi:hypothetical protein